MQYICDIIIIKNRLEVKQAMYEELDIVEATIMKLIDNGLTKTEITRILGFDIQRALNELIYKGYINPDMSRR